MKKSKNKINNHTSEALFIGSLALLVVIMFLIVLFTAKVTDTRVDIVEQKTIVHEKIQWKENLGNCFSLESENSTQIMFVCEKEKK